jgi:hypothetical protein
MAFPATLATSPTPAQNGLDFGLSGIKSLISSDLPCKRRCIATVGLIPELMSSAVGSWPANLVARSADSLAFYLPRLSSSLKSNWLPCLDNLMAYSIIEFLFLCLYEHERLIFFEIFFGRVSLHLFDTVIVPEVFIE